jgi:hypothetical protein
MIKGGWGRDARDELRAPSPLGARLKLDRQPPCFRRKFANPVPHPPDEVRLKNTMSIRVNSISMLGAHAANLRFIVDFGAHDVL